MGRQKRSSGSNRRPFIQNPTVNTYRVANDHANANVNSEQSPVIKKNIQLSDFKITRIVGEGHQGKVVQALHKKKEKWYALKIVPTKLIKEQKQIQHIFNEKETLQLLRDERRYFPKIYNCFSDCLNLSPVRNESPTKTQKSNNISQSISQFLVF